MFRSFSASRQVGFVCEIFEARGATATAPMQLTRSVEFRTVGTVDFLRVLASIALAYYLGIIVHELGHLAGGWAVGFKMLRIKIGQGQPWWQRKIGDFEIIVGSFPFGGMAGGIALEWRAFRLKSFFLSAAGPVATGSFVVLLVLLAEVLVSDRTLQIGAIAAFMMQGLILLQNLWPHDVYVDGEKYRSDGAQMWDLLFMKRAELATRYCIHALHNAQLEAKAGRMEHALHLIEEGLQGIEKRDANFIRNFQIGFLTTHGFLQPANVLWDQLMEVAETDEALPGAKMLDGLASIPVFWDAPSLLPKALVAIERAIVLAPEEITLHGTHGSLLLLSGSTEAGMKLLQHVRATSQAGSDQAICTYFLALGTHQAGQQERAWELYAEAARQYPTCSVGPKIRKLIGSRPATVLPPADDPSEKTLRELEEMAPL